MQPQTLIVGGSQQSLTLEVPLIASSAHIAIEWNGSSRPFTLKESSSAYDTYGINLTASDVAASGIGTAAVVDTDNAAVIASFQIPVVYPVTATDSVYDSTRGRLYVTPATPLPGTTSFFFAHSADSRFPLNSLVAIDVQTGAIAETLDLKAPGSAIALSDDGKALYVMVAPNIVRRVDPDTFTAAGDFTLPQAISTVFSTTTPLSGDLAVMPGSETSLAVNYPVNSGGTLAVFDNGAARTNTQSLSTSSYPQIPSKILFSPDGKFLIAGPSPVLFPVDASGVGAHLTTGLGGPAVAIVGDVLYTSNGISLNWHTMQPVGNLDGALAISVDASNQRILGVFSGPNPYSTQVILQAFDLATETPFGASTMLEPPVHLDRFGSDGLIYRSASDVLFFHTPLAAAAPSILPNGIVSAASFTSGSVSPGEIVSIFGSSLGPSSGQSFTVSNHSVLQPPGMEVWFGSTKGTVLFSYSGQMNAVAPFELQPGATVNVQVWNNGIPSAQFPVTVSAALPAVFTRDGSGKGLVSMVNQDGTVNAPAPPGSIVSLYGTGGGVYPGALDSVTSNAISSLSGDVHVTIGGEDAQVLYAGPAPSLISSVFQLNVQIPSDLAPGSSVPVVITVAGQPSPQGVTIEIR